MKPSSKRFVFVLCAALLPVVVFYGCSKSRTSSSSNNPNTMRGTIRISGAFALYPMMERWKEEYTKSHPEVRIDVSAGGAGKGVADTLGGLVDIGMVSRDIHQDEEAKGGFWVSVVKDAVVPVANAGNPVASDLFARGVSQKTFTACWMENKPLTWGELVGKPEVKARIQVYTRSDACGAAETWGKYLGGKQEDLQGVAVYGDPGLAEAIQRDKNGIGYNNLNYAYDTRTGKPVTGLMIIPIDINGNGTLDTEERFYATRDAVAKAIAAGVYPSPPARDLNLLTKGKPTGVTLNFIQWILTDGQQFVDSAGYIRLTDQKIADAKQKLQ